jgi:hypothetical protein
MVGERKSPLTGTKLHGDTLKFTFDEEGQPTQVVARVNGQRLDAQVTRGGKTTKYVGQKRSG